MDFEAWLLSIGKSHRSAKSYASAVSGVISTWAKDSGIINGSLLEIHSAKQLSEVVDEIKSIELFVARNTKGNGMYSSALAAYLDYLADTSSEDVQEDITDLLDDRSIGSTEKAMLVNARVGQGKFRQQLIERWRHCALTGFSDSRFLVASHIKPWRSSTHTERLDPFNGLLLLPNLDKVFDLGFISFTEEGRILISRALENEDILGVRAKMEVALQDNHQKYMDYHRERVFKTE